MDPIVAARLRNQLLAGGRRSPVEVVAALGAVQAQDYAGAKWALGLRSGASEQAVERALERGELVRSHPMRGTHHFVAPADLRWLLALIAPRSLQSFTGRHRQLGLDPATLRRALAAISRALEGGRSLTRAETCEVLRRARIEPDGQRAAHIIGYAEVTGLVCSGPRRGKQITIALLDERIPPAPALTRDAALGELARRYFTTRGPATVRDFVWWSSLTVAEARRAVELAGTLRAEEIAGIEYWRGDRRSTAKPPRALLLPSYDEYTVAYRDRAHAGEFHGAMASRVEGWLLSANIVLDGRIAGVWYRTLARNAVRIELALRRTVSRPERAAVEEAAHAYAAHLGLRGQLAWA